MSKSHLIPYYCPRCGAESEVTAWESINATLDPKLKDDLLNGKLWKFTCDKCEYSEDAPYSLLYHDMRRHFMVWLVPPEADGRIRLEENDIQMPEAEQMGGYHLRLVASVNDLIEKILLFDAGLDDRVIEVLKGMIRRQEAGGAEGQSRRLLFADAKQKAGGSFEELFFVEILPEGEQRSVGIAWEEGYVKAARVLHEFFHVAEDETPEWQQVDTAYYERLYAENVVAKGKD
jgi:hypothetical protein